MGSDLAELVQQLIRKRVSYFFNFLSFYLEEFVDKISLGDVVMLNSGGPRMTVKGIIGEDKTLDALKIAGHKDGDIIVEYFNNGKLENGVFHPSSIHKVEKIRPAIHQSATYR